MTHPKEAIEAVARALLNAQMTALERHAAGVRLTMCLDLPKDITAEASLLVDRIAPMLVAAEREACARVADREGVHRTLKVYDGGPDWYKHGQRIAAAIRGQGGK